MNVDIEPMSATEDERRCPRWMSWLMWSLAASFFFFEYFARLAPSVMTNELMRDFRVGALALGNLSAFFYYPYVIMQIPVGMLVDRLKMRPLLTAMVALCALGCFLFAVADHLIVAQLGRFIMGLTSAFAFVGAVKLATNWFPPSRLGLVAGMTQALGMFGAAVGDVSVAYIVDKFGWQATMYLVTAIFILLAVLMGIFLRDAPRGGPVTTVKAQVQLPLLKSLNRVFSNPQSWFNAFYLGMVYAPTAAFAEMWGVPYLSTTYHVATDMASLGIGLIFIGWAIGGPLAGWLSDRMGRRRPIMMASALLGCVFLGIVIYFPQLPLWFVYVCLFLFGVSNTGVGVAYAVSTEINPPSISGTSLGFANLSSVIIGAAFLQPIIGWFLELHWNGLRVHQVPVYSTTDYQIALSILPVCLFLGFLFSLAVKETHCKRVES